MGVHVQVSGNAPMLGVVVAMETFCGQVRKHAESASIFICKHVAREAASSMLGWEQGVCLHHVKFKTH